MRPFVGSSASGLLSHEGISLPSGFFVAEVQRRQSELEAVEVKSAHGGTPQRLYESLSALANRSGGRECP